MLGECEECWLYIRTANHQIGRIYALLKTEWLFPNETPILSHSPTIILELPLQIATEFGAESAFGDLKWQLAMVVLAMLRGDAGTGTYGDAGC
jgi:hypothetical protein